MKMTLQELMEKLGVDRVLTPYEAQPWFLYEEDQGITCSAEVRVGPGYDDIETEIQFLYDDWDESMEEEEEESGQYGDGGGYGGDSGGGMMMAPPMPKPKNPVIDGRRQVMLMRMKPSKEDIWSTSDLIVKGENYFNKFPKWDEKGCDFFRAAVESIQMGFLPDIDQLIESQLADDSEWGSGRRGRIGRKSPKANPAALLGMKK